MKYKPVCIKCRERYDSDEPDDYYCETCNEERLKVAKEIDRKIATMPPKRPRMSDLQKFDAIAKAKGGGCHVNISDMGITL